MSEARDDGVLGLAACGRFVAVAGLAATAARSSVKRVARAENRGNRAWLVASWAEREIVASDARLVALVTGGPFDDACREAVRRSRCLLFEVNLEELARMLGAPRPSRRAIADALRGTDACIAVAARLEPTSPSTGPRTDRRRYREMAVLALAAAFAVRKLSDRRAPPHPAGG